MARLLLAILLATFAFGGEAAARDLQEVLKTGTLRVGVTLFAPWAARGANGELIGFEVDVARQLAADMGVKEQIFPYDVDRLIPALESAHALAVVERLDAEYVAVCLSGRGDKDLAEALAALQRARV